MLCRFKSLHLLVAFLLCGVSVLRAQVVYKDFGRPPGDVGAPTTTVIGINSAGDIVGYYIDYPARNDHSFLISQGSFYGISFPGVASTRVQAINNSGQMVGYFYGTDNKYHGFLLSGQGGTFTQIDAPGGILGTHVTAMNNSGQIVGWYRDAARNDHGFLLSGGTYTTIDVPGADQGTYTVAINNSGEILGYSADSGGADGYEEHGYLLSTKGVFTQIDAPGATDLTEVVGINDANQVVGYFYNQSRTHGFLFYKGNYTSIEAPAPYLLAVPAGINESGQIAGTMQRCPTPGSACGFLLSGKTYTTIYPPGAPGANLQVINNPGQMVGVFYDASNVPHVYEANPVCLDAGGDTDGDELCDDWETNGLYVTVKGAPVFLDLPAMGADPKHKDVFVQLDTIANGSITQAALNIVINAFANAPVSNPDGTTGINLHIDSGPNSTMNPVTGATWDALSKAAPQITDVANLGNFDVNGKFSWDIFNAEKDLNFPAQRKPAFHYAISEPTEIFYPDGKNNASGISDGIPGSDFIVALSSPVSERELTGTFMHELGHNLGLHHGGGDDINQKPNYLSIMNYEFQFSGLQPGNIYDYSRFGPDSDASNLLPVLNEAFLNETTGLGTASEPVGANVLRYESVRYCPGNPTKNVPIMQLNGPIDWDCNQVGSQDDNATGIAVAGINGDASGNLILLAPYDDWAHLIFKGGDIGSLAAGAAIPSTTQNIEPTREQLQEFADFWAAQAQQQDNTPPATTAMLSPQPNAAGWNNTNVAVTLDASDNPDGSGVKQISYSTSGAQTIAPTATSSASTVINLTAEGKTTITYFATDIAGNAEAPHMLTVQIDKTPPTISATATPPPNVHGWNNTDVTASFACSDSLSGLAPGSPPAAIVISTEGLGRSVTGTCTDIAGNSSSATLSNINIDKTPPTIMGSRAPLPNANGWNNTDVTVNFVCSDSLSGIDTCGPQNQVVSSEGVNQFRSGTAVDLAGNSATATVGGINIDKTPPTMNCSANPSVLWPPNHKLINVSASVLVSDSLSGPAGFGLLSLTSNEPDSGMSDIQGWLLGKPSTSGQLRAERLGTGRGRVYTFMYQGMDQAGNSAACTPAVVVPHDQGH